MFSNTWRTVCIALYAGCILLGLVTGGVPSDLNEILALLVIPALTLTFIYFFYKGAFARAKKFGRSRQKRVASTSSLPAATRRDDPAGDS